jgi:hypothetical protein
MLPQIKFFKTPADPENYLLFLRKFQSEALKTLTEKCTTLDSSGFKRLLSQKQKIDKEVRRVERIITFNKYNESQQVL